jgi:hypothetical protein
MNKFIAYVLLLLVGVGLGYSLPHGAKQSNPNVAGIYETNPTQFISGFTAGSTNQFSVSSTGAVSTSATANKGTLTLVAGTATTTVAAGSICVASNTTASGTVETYASTSGSTLTVKGNGTNQVNYLCW